jgi:RHS repeat-associated protein
MDSAGAKGSAEAPARKSPFEVAAPPPLSLPKSGGALRGLGEKFQAGGPTGTGSIRVALPVSSCRGAEPSLALSYDTGHGAGPFGIGWAASVPSITRRTDRGIPRYQDAAESDVFILSGQEDLVPELTASSPGGWAHQTTYDGDYHVDAFRPRVEGSFARVERRTHKVTGDTHWRSITADNVTSVFGLSPGARIANPKNPLQVFRWLLEATYDALGHVTFYEYKGEDLTGVSRADPSEASRFASPLANAYLKRVHYGNRAPLTTRNPSYADLAALSWLFEVVFDYGEHTTDLPQEIAPWTVRPDPFSTFRAGFEIRTYRLCRRVLSFHEIPEELGAPARLVRATELTYDASPTVAYLTSIREVGYVWGSNDQVTTAAMPTLRLDYTRVGVLSTTVSRVDPSSLAQVPSGIDGQSYQFVDLNGEGIAGILSAAASPSPALYYKRNLGGGAFAAAERLPTQPARPSIAGGMQLLSLNADGRLDVAMLDGPTPGFYERTRDFAWSPFSAFSSVPRIDWQARGVHLLDVDGDGLTDVLVAQDDVFVWYPSLARDGFGPPHRVTQAHDEDRGAVVLTTDDYQTIFLADMTGDGLHDLVRIRNGEVCYWPNLGYGRFGAKIAMKNAPRFDRPDLFDPRRIRLGDVDGTGVTDIVYLARRGADVYLNQAGNGWGDGTTIPLPLADTMASVHLVDFLGTGTACIVWSSCDPVDAGTALRYVDLLRSTKPHLLCSVVNGLGAQTTITYAPSTKFYLEDRLAGRLWATRLPFVVHTVAQVETTDAVAGTKVVLRYRYAHGFYDGVEREFRGFARVDSWDAESMSADHGAGSPPGGLVAQNGEYDLPPVHTVSWFHTGAWNGEADDLRAALSVEFYGGDPAAPPLAPDTVPATLLPPALREAYRALKGRPLREEVYAEDGTPAASAPYVVKEYRYEVREIQPIATQRYGVYHPFEREHLAFNYERNPADPRIAHRLALEIDPLGHVVREAQVAYARRTPAEAEQGQVLATCRSTTFADPIATAYDFRHGVATETAQYELLVAPTASPLPLGIVDSAMTGATAKPFDSTLVAGTMRTLGHVRHQFWADDLSAPLPQGQVQTRALPYDHFALAFPATLLASVFGSDVTSAELLAAGYVSPDGDSWTHAGTTAYDAASFYQATSFTDPFGNTASVVYDPLRLAIVEEHTSADPAFDNVTAATIDYRVLAPSMVTDPNGNRSAVAFDELGRVVAVAQMGRAGANEGDTLADPTTKIEYDILAWEAAASPVFAHTSARLEHGPSNPGWFESYTYSDGSGHEVLRKIQAEPDAGGNPRWIGTGRTVFDNKGNAIKKYEEYFAGDPGYDTEPSLVATGYSAILRYDPLSRLVRTDLPDGTVSTTELDAWHEVSADGNDNVLSSAWYADASSRPASDPLHRAAGLAAQATGTPTTRVVDALGRSFLVIADNGPGGKLPTRTTLDVQGNALAVTDARGVVTRQQTFDARGRAVQAATVDAGTSSMLADGAGAPYRDWDARGFVHRIVRDILRRTTQVWVTTPGGPEYLAEQIVYGEGLSAPNFRGHVYQHFDGAGVTTSAVYDFEGHVLQVTQQLAVAYQTTPAWAPLATLTDPTSFLPAAVAANLLEGDVFVTARTYDALSRVVTTTTHDQTLVVVTYNAGSFVEAITAYLRGSTTASPIVTNVDYNAHGQRTRVAYGQGVVSEYTYDDRTHVVRRVKTTRASDGARLQDLTYTYDAVQNVVEVDDLAQQTVYFAGNGTSGSQQFEYDAVYRLIHAAGREQPGQVGYAKGPDGYPEAPFSSIPHPNDLQALLAYTETYSYDAVGNLQATVHKAAGAGWTRTQTYVPGTNRIDRVSMPGDPAGGPYSGLHEHDANGNVTRMPHLTSMTWDHAGRLVSADFGGGGTAYFTCDAAGARTRKLVVRSGRVLERVYLGGYERYRERSGTSIPGSTVTLERETLQISDGTRRFAIVETKTADKSVPNLIPSPLFRFQFPNHLDSACLETDPSGTIISYEEYYPYGGSSFRAGDVNKRYRFAGKERDEETGLSFFGARYYAPWIARWLGPDPHTGARPGSTPYGYAGGNPISRSDPDGRDDSPQPWLAGRYPVSQPAPPGSPPGTPPTVGSPYRIPAGGIVVDPLAAAARVHGGTMNRLETLSREYWELRTNYQKEALIRPWELEYLASYSGDPGPMNARVDEADSFVESGLAEKGGGAYHSTVLEQAIEGGLITNQADQTRFLAIAESERMTGRVKWAAWRGVKMAAGLIPAGQGAGGALFAQAPQSAPAALNALNAAVRAANIEGRYVNVMEWMSQRAIAFQELVSGGIKGGTSFLRGGVKFDAVLRGVLIDAKGPGYANFVDTAGKFYEWFAGTRTLVEQAQRQIAAAKGMAIEWHFAEQKALDATAKLFAERGITGIKLVLH